MLNLSCGSSHLRFMIIQRMFFLSPSHKYHFFITDLSESVANFSLNDSRSHDDRTEPKSSIGRESKYCIVIRNVIIYPGCMVFKKYIPEAMVGWFMVFSSTFNNISVISWMSVLLVEETRVTRENHVVVSKRYVNIIFVKMLSHFIPFYRNG